MTKLFYGWRMAIASGAITFTIAAVLNHSFGAYVAVLAEETGWSKTALSGAAAMLSVESAIMGPMLGWLIDRFGPRVLLRVGFVLFAGGFVSLSQTHTLAGFYLSAVLLAVGASLCGYFPLTVTLIQWFEKYRARAISTMTLGSALGGLMVPVIAWCMLHFGWRTTALGCAAAVLAIGLPLSSQIVRRPQDIGLTVDGLPERPPASPATHGPPASVPLGGRDYTLLEALRTPAFWLLAAGHGIALLVVTAISVHAITHMKESLGYSVPQAAFMITLVMMGQILGVVLSAVLGDHYDKRHVAALCMLGHAAGLLMLTYLRQPVLIGTAMLIHGVAWGTRGPFMQAMRADYFGRKAIGKILGMSAIFVALGQIGGPLVAGGLADLTGNYRAGYTLLALAAGSGTVLFLLLRKPGN